MTDQGEKKIDLSEKFPNMKPISSVPPLFRINGCGVSVYGRRDFDAETGTYVKTYCLCILFIPVLAFTAYRVAEAPEGWYFIGKEKLSGLARTWNQLVFTGIAAAIALGMWNAHTSSQEYQDKKLAKQAAEQMEDGNVDQALKGYRDLYARRTAHADEAKAVFQEVFEKWKTKEPSADHASRGELFCSIERRRKNDTLFPNMPALLVDYSQRSVLKLPDVGMQYLDQLKSLDPKHKEIPSLHLQLLTRQNEMNPKDVDIAMKLAMLHEAKSKLDECHRILFPVKDQLGTGEGARILGQILVSKGRHDDAYVLLQPYVAARMDAMKTAEEAYTKAQESAVQRALNHLNSNPYSSDYQRISKIKDKTKQQEVIDEYLRARMKQDKGVKRKLEDYIKAAGFVPIALELGMLQLNRAQEMDNAAARRKELEAAEKTFLSVSSVAAGSDQYQLSLGEVYYWLGKPEQGNKELQAYLVNNKRRPMALLSVGRILRGIGLNKNAKELAIEAFEKGKNTEEKDAAVSAIFVCCTDEEEKIQWLEKASKKNKTMQIEMHSTKGKIAMAAGNEQEAEKHFRAALAGYRQQPDSPAMCNNGALCAFDLYRLTGDANYFSQGAAMMKRASELEPQNAILHMNATSCFLSDAILSVVRDKINLKSIKQGASGLLPYLYANAEEKARIYRQICEHHSFQEGQQSVKKLYVLAPKNAQAYSQAFSYSGYKRDADELKLLYQTARRGDPDLSESIETIKNSYAFPDPKSELSNAMGVLKRCRALLAENPKDKNLVSFAILASQLVVHELAAAAYGHQPDAQKLVQLAEEAVAAHPCAGTHSTLSKALAYRACRTISAENPEFRTIYEQSRQFIDANTLLAFALACKHPAFAGIVEDKDVQRIYKLKILECRRFPNDAGPERWAFVHRFNSKLGREVRDRYQKNAYFQVAREFTNRFYDFTIDNRILRYLYTMMMEEPAEARRIAEQSIKEGIPFPRL